MSKLKEGKIYCASCNFEMKKVVLSNYEFFEGYPLKNVSAFKCLNCGKLFFTEEQVAIMNKRTAELRQSFFGFERTVTKSGRSLAITIPSELVDHLKIRKGEKIKVIPLAKDGFVIKVK